MSQSDINPAKCETYTQFERPNWDHWYLAMCLVVSQRSIDTSTKHGCVIVGEDREVLSIGYNSPPRNCNDSDIPQTRPEKYNYLEHSESNGILNAARIGVSLRNSTFYITGYPCHDCIRKIINVGAKRVVYGEIDSHCNNNYSVEAGRKMLENQRIEFVKIPLVEAEKILEMAKTYSINKKQKINMHYQLAKHSKILKAYNWIEKHIRCIIERFTEKK